MSGGAPNPGFAYPNVGFTPASQASNTNAPVPPMGSNAPGFPGLPSLPGLNLPTGVPAARPGFAPNPVAGGSAPGSTMPGVPGSTLPGVSGAPGAPGAPLPTVPGAPSMPGAPGALPGMRPPMPNLPGPNAVGSGLMPVPMTVPTPGSVPGAVPGINQSTSGVTGLTGSTLPAAPAPTAGAPAGLGSLPMPNPVGVGAGAGTTPRPGVGSMFSPPSLPGMPPRPTLGGTGGPAPVPGASLPVPNLPTPGISNTGLPTPGLPTSGLPSMPGMPGAPSGMSQAPAMPVPTPANPMPQPPAPVPGSSVSVLNTLSARPRAEDLSMNEGDSGVTSPFALNSGTSSLLPPEPVMPGAMAPPQPVAAPPPAPGFGGAPAPPGQGMHVQPASGFGAPPPPVDPRAYPSAPPVGLPPQGGSVTSPSAVIGGPPHPTQGAGTPLPPGVMPAQPQAYVPPPYVIEPLPKYVSLCTSKAPANSGLRARLQVPQGIILRPFANPPRGAEPLPLVDFGSEEEVVRCQTCRAYISPYAMFTLAGAYWNCNFCGTVNEVSSSYFAALDEKGYRKDLAQRPELTHASYEMIAPPKYSSRSPAPPTFLFIIDVSHRAAVTGLVDAAASAILAALSDLPGGVRTRIGFITVDSSVHIYKFRKGKQTAVYSISDLDEVFTPCGTELVTRNECIEEIRSFLTRLPTVVRNTRDAECAAGAAIEVAKLLLEHTRGGRLSMILGGMPTLGPGKLTNREPARSATASENELLKLRQPADAFYTRISRTLAKMWVTVDVYVASMQNQFVDVATLNELPRNSCGQLRYYPAFDGLVQHGAMPAGAAGTAAAQFEQMAEEMRRQNSSERLQHDLRRALTRSQAWEAMIRIRATTGVGLRNVFGNYTVDNTDLMCTPCIDCDKTFAVELHSENHLTRPIFVQCALLYTTSCGQRRIRVHTVCIPVSNMLEELFQSIDINATTNFLAREAAVRAIVEPLPQIRDSVLTQCTAILRNYRAITGRSNPNDYFSGTDLARLSLMALGTVKSAAFRDSAEIRPDMRSYYLGLLRIMSLLEVETLVRPRLLQVTNLDADVGIVNPETGVASLPEELPLSAQSLNSADVYLVDNGLEMYLRLGKNTSSSWLRDVFGVDDINSVRSGPNASLPPLGYAGIHRTRLQNLINYLRQESGNYQPLHIVKEADPSEKLFFSLLIEDACANTLGWAQFLNHIVRG